MGEDDWETIFSALRNVYRRRLLVALVEQDASDDTVPVPEAVAGDHDDLSVLQANLIHTHLPQLEQAGYITWEQDTHQITRGPHFDEIQPVIELLHDHQDELPAGWV